MRRRLLLWLAVFAVTVGALLGIDPREGLAAKPPAGGVVTVHASDVGGVMVMGNLTVTEPDASGFTTAYPCTEGRPLASNNNYLRGETTPNFVAVRADVNGNVCLYTQASAHLIWDQVAELPDLTVHNANRLADTRNPDSTPLLPPAPGGASASPLSPNDAPDPFVLSVDPSYCATLQNATPPACYYAYTTQVIMVAVVPVWRSTDLVTWTQVGEGMPNVAPWVQWGRNWAPGVLERPGNSPDARFVMWYTAHDQTSGRMCLGVAVASTPTGPFVDSSTTPAYCPAADQGDIDASPFVHADNTVYLTYKASNPAGIRIASLTADGRAIVQGTEHELLSESAPENHGKIVEGPTMIRANGQLYLYYSWGPWWTVDYRVGVLRCDAPFGPCTWMNSTAVLATRGSMAGTGGQTPFQSPSGDWYMMFHAWTLPQVDYPAGLRRLHLLPITLSNGNVQVG
jgi:hypothetical protein